MFEAVCFPGVFLSLSWHPVPGRFYCPDCISQTKPPQPVGWGNRDDVARHLRVAHGWESPTASDALASASLVEALQVWKRGQEEAADEFADGLLLVRNVRDFLSECET